MRWPMTELYDQRTYEIRIDAMKAREREEDSKDVPEAWREERALAAINAGRLADYRRKRERPTRPDSKAV